MTSKTKVCITDKTGEQESRFNIGSIFSDVRETIAKVIVNTEQVTDSHKLIATDKMSRIIHGSKVDGLPNGGWTNFVDDKSRSWNSLSLKIATFEVINGIYERLVLDIQANGTHTAEFQVQIVPTIKKIRVNCDKCFQSFLENTGLEPTQYIANAVPFSAKCDYCEKLLSAGKGILVTVQYHVNHFKTKVPYTCDCPNTATKIVKGNEVEVWTGQNLRGYVGKGSTTSHDDIIGAVLRTRHLVAEGLNSGTLSLSPVKAQEQHDYRIETATNLWTGDTIKANKVTLAALSL